MINFNDVTKENIEEHSSNWPQILDHPYRLLIVRSPGSENTNLLFNLISHQSDVDKICLCAKDPYETKHQSVINKRESTGLKHLHDSKVFIEYSNNVDDIFKNIKSRI